MKRIKLNTMCLDVDPRIESFEIFRKESSNVEFFGIDHATDQLVMQFRNGTSYIYSKLPADILKQATEAESIGKFFSSNIAGKFESNKIAERLIIRNYQAEEEEAV